MTHNYTLGALKTYAWISYHKPRAWIHAACRVLCAADPPVKHSDALDSRRSTLTLQLLLIPILLLLLAIFQTRAVVRLQHPVLAAEVTLTEAAITNNPLRYLFAILRRTSYLLRCTSSDR